MKNQTPLGNLRGNDSAPSSGGHAGIPGMRGRTKWFRVSRLIRSGHAAFLFLICAAVLCSSCAALSSRVVSDPAPGAARLRAGGSLQAEVNLLAQPLIDSGEACGMAVAVVGPDGVARTYGYGRTGRRGDGQPPGGDTIFQIGSVSKLFMDALLARLVQEGQLSYQDTVRSILPANVPLSADAGDLTLYELVTNTGGLPRQPNNPRQMWYFISFLFTGHNLYGCINKNYLYDYLRTCRLPPKAKRVYGYSNIGIGLLTHLIEVKTGRSISDLLDEKICRPLNLHDTVLHLSAEQKTRLAVGHPGNQPKFMPRSATMEPWDMGGILGGSCGLYSTANDLMVFARANLGQLHHPLEPLLMSMQAVRVKAPREDVGLGWSVNYFNDFNGGRLTLVYKHGMVAGYSAYVGVNAERQVAVVALCNNFNWHDKVGHNLLLRLSEAYAPARDLRGSIAPPAESGRLGSIGQDRGDGLWEGLWRPSAIFSPAASNQDPCVSLSPVAYGQ
jgi:CubicO group peptidase (beta-lactamase class C family)